MRKSVRLILALFAVLMIMSGTASADEYDSMWVSFLDYDTGGPNGNYLTLTDEAQFDFTLPFVVGARSFQGFFMYNGKLPSAVYVTGDRSSTEYPCTVLNLGNGLCRFYLSSTSTQLSDSGFSLHFTGNGTSTVINLLEFEYSEIRTIQYQTTGTLYVTGGNLDTAYNQTMSSAGSALTCSFPSDSNANYGFTAQLYCSNWRRYDYLDIWVSGYIEQLESVTADCNGIQLPLTVQYLPSDDNADMFNSILRIDLRDISRTSTYTPMILIAGFAKNNVSSYISLKNVVGIVEISETDPELSILNRILNDMNWYLMTDFSIQTNMSGDIVSGFSDLTDAIAEHFDSFQSLFTDTISGFRSSMESYLDALPARIAEELAKIFQPTEGHFEEAADQSSQLAEEKLGAVYQAAGVIDQIAGAFTEQTTQTFIAVPVLRVNVLPDVPFEFGGWEVPVVPPGMESVFEVVKFAIDIVCTLAFLNGMKRRLERFLGGASDAD